ncbi:MAG: GNAT family acetyltransferase, partial [Clostridia bacterium]|nr:GNAT family acetyltransferase [Clostridia bacterium]
MEHIELLEVQKKYAEEIWKFRQEILECDAADEDQFAG